MERYKLTPAEIEDLEKRGIKPGEISTAEQTLYSFEDWLKGNPLSLMGGGWGVRPHYLDENDHSTSKVNGKLTLFILPESEWLKIEKYKEEKLNGFVQAYFEALTETFEIQEKGSLEPLWLAEGELDKVINLIEDKFPRRTNGVVYTNLKPGQIPSIWLQYRNDCGEKANVSYWYKEICVNGEKGVRYVDHRHTTLTASQLNSLHPEDLHFVVSALAFHQFKKYLTSRLQKSSQAKNETVIFNNLFVNPESMEQALVAAEKIEMIRRNGEVIVWAHKWQVGAIVIFWEHLQTMNPPMVHFSIDSRLAIDAIAEKFGVTVSDRTKRGTPNYRGNFLKALKVVLE